MDKIKITKKQEDQIDKIIKFGINNNSIKFIIVYEEDLAELKKSIPKAKENLKLLDMIEYILRHHYDSNNSVNEELNNSYNKLKEYPAFIEALKNFIIKKIEAFENKDRIVFLPKSSKWDFHNTYKNPLFDYIFYKIFINISSPSSNIKKNLKLLFKNEESNDSDLLLVYKIFDEELEIFYSAFANGKEIEKLNKLVDIINLMKIEYINWLIKMLNSVSSGSKETKTYFMMNKFYLFTNELFMALNYFYSSKYMAITEQDEQKFEFKKLFDNLGSKNKKTYFKEFILDQNNNKIKEFFIKNYFKKEAIDSLLKDN